MLFHAHGQNENDILLQNIIKSCGNGSLLEICVCFLTFLVFQNPPWKFMFWIYSKIKLHQFNCYVFFCQVDIELFHCFHDFSGALLASLAISNQAENLTIAVRPDGSEKMNSSKSGDSSNHESISSFWDLTTIKMLTSERHFFF